jgi:phosphoribosylglycinamide formyltransferase-1
MAKLKIGVLISGRGSNLQALIDTCSTPDFPAEIVLVLSNIHGVMGLERAAKAEIPTAVLDYTEFESREAFDQEMSEVLEAGGVEFVFMAGFLRLLSDPFVERWYDRLVNIHPSLLPAFKGLNVHPRIIEEGARFSGCTVHFVRPALDDGPIIVQACVPVHQDDTPDVLAARVLEQEHVIYPMALKLIAERRVRVADELAVIEDPTYPSQSLINPAN